MRAVEVLPFVPVMWIEGYARWGSPSTSISAAIRVTDGSSFVSPQRPASSCSTARSALSTSGSAGRAGTASPWGVPACRAQGTAAGLDHRQVGVTVGLGVDDLVERVGLLTHKASLRRSRSGGRAARPSAAPSTPRGPGKSRGPSADARGAVTPAAAGPAAR